MGFFRDSFRILCKFGIFVEISEYVMGFLWDSLEPPRIPKTIFRLNEILVGFLASLGPSWIPKDLKDYPRLNGILWGILLESSD